MNKEEKEIGNKTVKFSVNKSDPENENVRVLQEELDWLVKVLDVRRKIMTEASSINGLYEIPPPQLTEKESGYGNLLKKNNFNFHERFTLIFALAMHISPKLLDTFKQDKPGSEFGGVTGKNHHGFIPTGETLMFVLAPDNMVLRLDLLKLFEKDHTFYKDNLVCLEVAPPGEPELSGVLTASVDLVDLVLRGDIRKPDLRPDFPAKLLSTDMDWKDVVLNGNTRSQLNEIELWINHSHLLLNDPVMGKKIKPGFRALFYGPPGTGKTLSACLIGKKTGRDVYRVDLSTIVSKYIGETEKNLAKLFDRASRKDWILFFDEADALFGKRTDVNDSHDRYANQEVSYLLQRIEYHEGLVILATNMKNNIDSAFLRRFQSIVYFPMPKAEERLQLWKQAFSETIPFQDSIDMNELASRYELSGSLISNIVTHTTLRALNEKSSFITASMLQDGIARELAKEGRTL
jgi:hypothetical protein